MIKKVLHVIIISCLFSNLALANGIESSLKSCATITSSEERLTCYDKIAKSLQPAASQIAPQPKSEVTSASAAPIILSKEQKEAEFGDHHLKKDKKPNELARVQFTVASIGYSSKQRLKITFENGQRWNQSDSETLRLKVGDKVELFKGAWSAIYLKKVGYNRKIRVKRVK